MDNFSLRREIRHGDAFEKVSHCETNLTLGAALLIAQDYHVILRINESSRLVIWGELPIDAACTIRQQEARVCRLIRQSHISVCPSPMLHKHSWAYVVRRDCCQLCAKLNFWIDENIARCA